MAAYYLDTSGLVKRYAVEAGTVWVTTLVDPAAGHDIFTQRITAVEVIAALYRRVRTGAASLADAEHAETLLRVDWQWQYQILEVSVAVVDTAMRLARRYGLRGFDAVHLASAIELDLLRRAEGSPSVVLISADQSQIQAAVAEGLAVEDPNAHQ